MIKLFLILLPLVSAPLLADGLPIDHKKGTIQVPHRFIKLTQAQVDEVELLDTLTLTAEQWRAMRKLRKGCPKRFDTIYPRDWADCTCGSENSYYAIQWSETQAAILLWEEMHNPTADLEEMLREYHSADLKIDRRGQLHHGAVLVPFPLVLKALRTPQRAVPADNSSQQPYVTINLPLGLTKDSPALSERLKKIIEVAEETGRKVHCY